MAVHLVGSWQADHLLLDDNANARKIERNCCLGPKPKLKPKIGYCFHFSPFFFSFQAGFVVWRDDFILVFKVKSTFKL